MLIESTDFSILPHGVQLTLSHCGKFSSSFSHNLLFFNTVLFLDGVCIYVASQLRGNQNSIGRSVGASTHGRISQGIALSKALLEADTRYGHAQKPHVICSCAWDLFKGGADGPRFAVLSEYKGPGCFLCLL